MDDGGIVCRSDRAGNGLKLSYKEGIPRRIASVGCCRVRDNIGCVEFTPTTLGKHLNGQWTEPTVFPFIKDTGRRWRSKVLAPGVQQVFDGGVENWHAEEVVPGLSVTQKIENEIHRNANGFSNLVAVFVLLTMEGRGLDNNGVQLVKELLEGLDLREAKRDGEIGLVYVYSSR